MQITRVTDRKHEKQRYNVSGMVGRDSRSGGGSKGLSRSGRSTAVLNKRIISSPPPRRR